MLYLRIIFIKCYLLNKFKDKIMKRKNYVINSVLIILGSAFFNVATANPVPGEPTPGKGCVISRCDHTSSNAELNHCVRRLFQEQDELLNKSYADLKSKLTSSQKQLLTKSQRAWLDFKKSENGFALDYLKPNSAAITLHECVVTKHRNEELLDFLEQK